MSTELINNRTSQKPYLVFSSVGQFSRASTWLNGNRKYDIWLTEYSSEANSLENKVEFLNYRKGAKWPNIKFAFETWPELFEGYKAIWIADDDLALSPISINKLFYISKKYNLIAAQPSFDPLGKNSYRITEEQPRYLLRHTNFVETGSVLLEYSTFKSFLTQYDGTLVAYGIDWLLMHFIQSEINNKKVAVIDAVRCHNPDNRHKDGRREIDKLVSKKQRIETFEIYTKKHSITLHKYGTKELGYVLDLNFFRVAFKIFRQKIYDKAKRRIRWAITNSKNYIQSFTKGQ